MNIASTKTLLVRFFSTIANKFYAEDHKLLYSVSHAR